MQAVRIGRRLDRHQGPPGRLTYDAAIERDITMSKLEIFEPALCCPTGVCGVNVDQALVQFNADVQWLGEQGVTVARHSLGHDAAAFAANAEVVREMEAGMDRLPIATLDGRIVSTGMYPSRAQLVQKLGMERPEAGESRASPGSCGCKPGTCC